MDELNARLLDIAQTDFPLVPRPFAELAERLNISEAEVLERLAALKEQKIIRSIRAMYQLQKLGYVSLLVASRVEESFLDEVVAKINAYPGVTHNYQRDHEYNVWFTMIAPNEERLAAVLDAVAALPGVVDLQPLPAQKTFKLRVDFKVSP